MPSTERSRWRGVRFAVPESRCLGRRGAQTECGGTSSLYYGSKELDASLLLLPAVGFLPPDDPRVQGTITAVEKNLMQDGFVARYNTRSAVDGLPGDEGKCSWPAASGWPTTTFCRAAMTKPTRCSNGCLRFAMTSGYFRRSSHPEEHRQLGNFPQAFSHLALINSAHNLGASLEGKPSPRR